ncbi:casein kinase 2 regulatory subunit [Entophlyctis sp. JEL0112]|nr:casein kinase 2 regulatory subunit [Entophlyctis sp. JEL0112]
MPNAPALQAYAFKAPVHSKKTMLLPPHLADSEGAKYAKSVPLNSNSPRGGNSGSGLQHEGGKHRSGGIRSSFRDMFGATNGGGSGNGENIGDDDEDDDEEEEEGGYVEGHEYFIEVPEEFIKDDFNLTGLNTLVLQYNEALDMILDLEIEPAPTPAQQSLYESSAEMLYGLIHQRFLLTKGGLGVMAERLIESEFGVCPRAGCGGAPVLPCGRSDQPNVDTVKLFCARCCDVYHPREAKFQNIDGACFGTTFPHLLYNAYPQLVPPVIPKESDGQEQTLPATEHSFPLQLSRLNEREKYRVYVPRMFGFRINVLASNGPRMLWLRWKDELDLGARDGVAARSMELLHRDENHEAADEDIFGDD